MIIILLRSRLWTKIHNTTAHIKTNSALLPFQYVAKIKGPKILDDEVLKFTKLRSKRKSKTQKKI